MKKEYTSKSLLIIAASLLIIASCKKDNKSTTPATATPVKLGMYEVDSSIYKLLYMEVSTVGTQTLSTQFNTLIFDTGSGGLVIDANGILPASMITSTGFNFTGDSTIVDGITITNQEATVEYGDDDASVTKVYGNLAYANVTIGDPGTGTVSITRLPFFMYYKGVDAKGNLLPAHYFDVLGVSPGYDVTFENNAYITSPFSYFTPGTGLTKGIKMAELGTSNFSLEGNFVPSVVSVGLTADDLSSTSGFVMSTLTFNSADGYYPYIPATATYNNKTANIEVIFDTGTEPYSYIEDKTAGALTLLPANSTVAIATTSGFNYTYTTTATNNLTYIENPTTSGADISILSLEFFLTNEYMLDYTDHKLGVKLN